MSNYITSQGLGPLISGPSSRRYASLAVALFWLAACSISDLDDYPEYEEFQSFVEAHYDNLNAVNELLLQNRSITNIWEIADEVRFSHYDGETKTRLSVPNADVFRALLPRHGNMLYLSDDELFLFGPGVMHDCHSFTCEVSATKFRGDILGPKCTPELIRQPSQSCFLPVYKEWHIRYSVFNLDA